MIAKAALVSMPLVLGMGSTALAAGPFPIERLVGSDTATHMLVTQIDACPRVPAPVVTLQTESRYDPKDNKSINVDPNRRDQYLKAIAPVRTYLTTVSETTNKSVAFPFARRAWAMCALDLLDQWASADALTNMRTNTARLLRGAQVATLALAALQIRDAVSDDPRLPRVATWLAGLARDCRDFVDSRPKAVSSMANHRYWNGLGVAAAGVLAADDDLVAWGLGSARIGLAQVNDPGFLPLELARGKRARDYHLYALAPLIMLAEVAALDGTNLYAEQNSALMRLASRVLESIEDPSAIATAAGTKQIAFPGGRALPPNNRLAWLEPYAARTGDARAQALLAKVRPVRFSALGGDLTLLFSDGLAHVVGH